MKLYLTLTILAVYIGVLNAYSPPEDFIAKVVKTDEECKKEVPDVEAEDVALIEKMQIVDKPAMRNFLFCFHKKFEVQHDDGSFDTEKAKVDIANWIGNHDHDADVEECAKDLHHDGPENAMEFIKCVLPKLPKDN